MEVLQDIRALANVPPASVTVPYRRERRLWSDALELSHAHARSSSHRPRTTARIAYSGAGLHLLFDVDDRFIVARHTVHQSSVCLDSCVEFFFQPSSCNGYFNFEFNCVGTVLAHYNDVPGGPPRLLDATRVDVLPPWRDPIPDEIAGPIHWSLEAMIPWELLMCGPAGWPLPGTKWTANFYKCADASSHPHWLSWQPIGDRLSFHQPNRFGELSFA
jgi:hypothetical protein